MKIVRWDVMHSGRIDNHQFDEPINMLLYRWRITSFGTCFTLIGGLTTDTKNRSNFFISVEKKNDSSLIWIDAEIRGIGG